MIAGKRPNGITNEVRDNLFDWMGRLHDHRKRIRGAAQDPKLSHGEIYDQYFRAVGGVFDKVDGAQARLFLSKFAGSLSVGPRFPGDVKVLSKLGALPEGELLVKTLVPIQDLEFNDVFPVKFMRALAALCH